MKWLIEKLTHPTLEIRLAHWSWLLALLALGFYWNLVPMLTLFTLSQILIAASFLSWAVPVIRKQWNHWSRNLIGVAFISVSGIIQTYIASFWVGSVTGFHPADYNVAVGSLAVLIFIPVSALMITIIGFIISFFAALLALPIQSWLEFSTLAFGVAPSDFGKRIWRRALGCLCLSMFSFVGCAIVSNAIGRRLDSGVSQLVKMLEYHPAPNHPWQRAFRGGLVHFHENGLVTKAIEHDDAIYFEAVIKPIPPSP